MESERSLIAPAIAVLASTPGIMRQLVASLPEELIAAPGGEGWSARDVVAHLAARQRPAIIGRIEAILAADGAAIPDIPDDLMEVVPYRPRPLGELLDEFECGARRMRRAAEGHHDRSASASRRALRASEN